MDSDLYGGGVLAGLIGLLLILLLIIGPLIYVVSSFFMMKIFEKAGVQGKWRAWVPVYNVMIFAKLGDISPWVVLIGIALSMIPYLNFITGIALAVVMLMAAWRVGLKLQKEAAWVVLFFFLSIVWMGILAFDRSRWNPNIAPAPWAGTDFLVDKTVWEGIPVQPRPAAPGGYGYQAQGYQAPPQGYQAPPQGQPGYPQGQPGYGAPAQPYGTPPQAPGAPAAPSTPPAPPAPDAAPPAPPAPPAPGAEPPARPADPNQPPA